MRYPIHHNLMCVGCQDSCRIRELTFLVTLVLDLADGILASGSWTVGDVVVDVEGDKTFPEGTLAKYWVAVKESNFDYHTGYIYICSRS